MDTLFDPIVWGAPVRVFRADQQRPWMVSHTACPVAYSLGGTLVRVYFGTRDSHQRPHVGWVELDLRYPDQPRAISEEPALGPGRWGMFDDNGVYPGQVLDRGDGELWMYYMGRSNGTPPLYYMSIGLAKSRDGGRTFERDSHAPILSRGPHDPWMVSTPWVMGSAGSWTMWYLSGLGWSDALSEKQSYYHIKRATSDDGLVWHRDGTVCIDFVGDETNIASPTVIRESNAYRMWFSASGKSHGYRLGYAESEDGASWTRHERSTPTLQEDWCASAAYPHVFRSEDTLYMLFSGAGFGAAGIGLVAARR